jgi:uncharacterized membrane protein (DUF2068 family)
VLKLQTPKSKTLFLIAVFKLFKGVGLLAVAFGALRFLHHDLARTLEHLVNALRVDRDNHYVNLILSRATSVSPRELKVLSIGTFFYSLVFLTEGTGLLLRKRWAEYFTIVSTGALIPLEVYELVRHITPVKILVMILNIAIVVYLILQLRKERA